MLRDYKLISAEKLDTILDVLYVCFFTCCVSAESAAISTLKLENELYFRDIAIWTDVCERKKSCSGQATLVSSRKNKMSVLVLISNLFVSCHNGQLGHIKRSLVCDHYLSVKYCWYYIIPR